jgi:DNA-binding NarL/FixJ family response regulator
VATKIYARDRRLQNSRAFNPRNIRNDDWDVSMSDDATPHCYANSGTRGDAAESGKSVLFLDERHLTRDCIGRELALRLPEFTIVPRATAQDLVSEDFNPSKIALVVRYVHADSMPLQARREALDQSGSIAAQLSLFDDLIPETPLVLMSEVEVPEAILEVFRSGVRGYLPTTLPIDQVAQAIRFVAAGGTFVPLSLLSLHTRSNLHQEVPNHPHSSGAAATFSPRQSEVIRMLWNGSSNKVIAYELRMAESTVKVHIRQIMKKLNVTNRTLVVLRTQAHQLHGHFHANDTSLHSPLRASANNGDP